MIDPALQRVVRENVNQDPEDISVEYQNDGLTSRNHVISSGDEKYVVRISSILGGELGIKMQAELQRHAGHIGDRHRP